MPVTIGEFVAPHGALSVQDAVRLAAFGVVLSTMAVSSGGGSRMATARPTTGERPDAPERRAAPERVRSKYILQ